MREDILSKLKNMRLSSMSEAYINQVNNPNSDLRPFEERFEEIVDAEWNARYNKKLNRFIKKATLKYPGADFDDSIYDTDRLLDTRTIEALTNLSWIADARNILITGSTGAGKIYGKRLMYSCLKKVSYCKIYQIFSSHP